MFHHRSFPAISLDKSSLKALYSFLQLQHGNLQKKKNNYDSSAMLFKFNPPRFQAKDCLKKRKSIKINLDSNSWNSSCLNFVLILTSRSCAFVFLISDQTNQSPSQRSNSSSQKDWLQVFWGNAKDRVGDAFSNNVARTSFRHCLSES